MTINKNKIKCAHCENEIHMDGDYKVDINADMVCDDCADKAVVMNVYQSKTTKEYVAHFEIKSPDPLAKNTEEHSTGYYEVRGAAVAYALLQAKKLYGENVVIVEE